MPDVAHTTNILLDAGRGEGSAVQALMNALYEELRGVAAEQLDRERPGHTLQPTALVHEAYLRMVDQTRVDWKNRAQFLAVAAEIMRRILVDHARAKGARKRGRDREREELHDELPVPDPGAKDAQEMVELDEALRALKALDERQARVVELKYFGGLTVEEIAHVLQVSPRTVKGDWSFARAWLQGRLAE